MACAHAKFTGEVGVCLATSGPGAIHLCPARDRGGGWRATTHRRTGLTMRVEAVADAFDRNVGCDARFCGGNP
jgi:hypothetical protein